MNRPFDPPGPAASAPFPSPQAGALAVHYDFRGASIDGPREWTEESILSITAPGPRPQPVVSLVRLTVPPETSLDLFAARRIGDLSKVVQGIRIEETRDMPFGGQRGISMRITWEENAGRIVQRLAMTKRDDALYVLTLNCLEDQAARCQPTWDSVASSFKLTPPAR